MDDRISDLLNEMADAVPPPSADPRRLESAVRRRVARTIVSVVSACALIASAGIVLARSATTQEVIAPPAPATKTSSALSPDRSYRCTAEVPSTVAPGRSMDVTVKIDNPNDHPVKVLQGVNLATLSIATRGVVHLDSTHAGSTPIPGERTLAPGEALVAPIAKPQVRWSGPLTIEVTCGVRDRFTLPPLVVDVSKPGANPPREDAIRRALATRPGLLERCMPGEDGSEAIGELVPPNPTLPSLTARCSAVVVEENGFDVVEIRIVAPADAPPFEFPDDLGSVAFPPNGLPGQGSMAVMRWRIVVTADEVFDDGQCCEAAERMKAAENNLLAPYLFWEEGRWQVAGGTACGAMGNGFNWISVCPP